MSCHFDHLYPIPPDGGPIPVGTVCRCGTRKWGEYHPPRVRKAATVRELDAHMTEVRRRGGDQYELFCVTCGVVRIGSHPAEIGVFCPNTEGPLVEPKEAT